MNSSTSKPSLPTINAFFKGKKITVMGLGLLGRGVGDVQFLAEMGAELLVTDLKKAEDLQSSLEELSEEKIGDAAKRITFILGEHRLQDFHNRDFILKAAGVPLNSPYIDEARKNGVPIEMSTALFALFAREIGATIVGITGTRGKSTVTNLIYEILTKAVDSDASASDRKVFLGGNVKGVATLPFLREIKKGDIAVLELDSWQLQGFAERKISPDISVFTTFLSDHQNYYGGASISLVQSMDAYLDDKAAILKFQTGNDYLVLGSQVDPIVKKKYGPAIKAKVIIPDQKAIPLEWNIKIPGEHNRYNIALAIEGAKAIALKTGIPVTEQILKEAVESFKGVPGRLEFLREVRKVKIYNDTTATTPDATVAALKALGAPGTWQNIILIAGGADKGLDMSELMQTIPTYCKKVILLPGSGTDKLLARDSGSDKPLFVVVPGLKDAVAAAMTMAVPHDVILLSPALASFGLFKNEYDRGEQFVAIVNSL